MDFKKSEEKLIDNIIAEINYFTVNTKSGFTYNEINDRIKKMTFETIQIQVLDICVLLNNRIVASTNNNSISIFDEKFNLIKKVDGFDEKPIYSFGVAVHKTNNLIYVSNWSNDCVYMLDYELNKIKSFGSQGSGAHNLYRPFGICYKDDHLYVCDASNQRIQILSSNLEYVDTLKLQYVPHTIKISNTSIGFCGSNNSINFYDIRTKNLKKQCPNVSGRISEIDSIFYLVSYNPTKKIFCFDTDGNLIEEYGAEGLNPYISYVCDGLILTFNNSIMLANNKGNILKF